MGAFSANTFTTNKEFTHCYKDISEDELANQVNTILVSKGYSLISGTNTHGVYERGNRVMRILFGAFIKYFKCHVNTKTNGDNETQVTLTTATSGMSGGLVGMSQVKNEILGLSEAFKTL
ncbi:hypothetical protein [uncultured Algibacter sp.]|uniref:hypothetical protein n=1 Tax=uncultured Algibacter sp. TaxID=298659 RepID=UPI0032173F9F